MNIESNNPSDFSVFQDSPYEKEVLLDNINYESTKTRNAIWVVALVLFLSALLSMLMTNVFSTNYLLGSLVVPIIFFSLGFLAKSQPVLSITITAILFAGLIVYSIFLAGATSIISGIIVKAVLVYFFIKGFNHAFEAKKTKESLKLLNL